MKPIYLLLVFVFSFNLICFAQPVVSNGPVGNVLSSIFQCQWQGFKNNGAGTGLYLGTDINSGSNRVTKTGNGLYLQPGSNAVSLSYNNLTDILTASLNANSISFPNVSGRIIGPGSTCRMNYLQILIGNDKTGLISFNSVTISGQSLGSFAGAGIGDIYWNITNVNFSAGFALTGTIVLNNGNFGGGANSYVSLTVGETAAVKSVKMNAACENNPALVSITGLLPNTNYTANYSIDAAPSITSPSFTTNAGGTGIMTSRNIVLADIGKTISILSVNSGCDWVPNPLNSTAPVTLKNVWIGSVSADWNNAANWTGNVLPDTNCINVIIPSGTSFNPLLSSGNYPIRNLVILNGNSLTINNASLKVLGTISNQGILDISNGTLELAGKSGVQQIAGSMFAGKTIQHLINNNSTGINLSGTATDTLRITGSLVFGNVNASILQTNDKLVLASTAIATAAVGDLTNDGLNTGNQVSGKVIVERYIPSAAKWRFLSVPTNSSQTFKQSWQENAAAAYGNPVAGYGVIIGDNRSASYIANGFDAYTPGGPTVKTFNAASNSWTGIASTLTAIKSASGYMTYIRSNRSGSLSATTMRTAGDLYTGTQPAITVSAKQFKAIGNPYAAAINLNRISIPGLQEVFYVWDPKAGGGYGLGAYQSLIKMGSDYVVFPGGGSYGAQLSVANTIESGQAFFVKAGALGGFIQFEENDKQIGSRMVFRSPEANSPMLRSTLYAVTTDSSTLLDAAMVNYHGAYANIVDEEDILKMTNGSENVSINKNAQLLMAERRMMVAGADTLQLNLTGVRVQQYKWSIALDYMDAAGRTAFLRDAYNNSLTPLNLNGTTEYAFSIVNIAGSYAANRFSIVFAQQLVVLPVTITTVAAKRSSSKSNEVWVSWKAEQEISLLKYEVEYSNNGSHFTAFATVTPTAGNSGAASYAQLHGQAGAADYFYRIKATSISGQVQYSAIVKVAGIKTNVLPLISVYPNPVVDKNMQVQFLNQPAVTYHLQLMSYTGAVVYQSKVEVNSTHTVNMQRLPRGIAPGQYQLRVTGSNDVQVKLPVLVL
jgi:hypothetical protein